jgi:hypothetical protein
MRQENCNFIEFLVSFDEFNLVVLSYHEPSLIIIVRINVDSISNRGHFHPYPPIIHIVITQIFDLILTVVIQGYLRMFPLQIRILNIQREPLSISLLVVARRPSYNLSIRGSINVESLSSVGTFDASQSIIEDSNVNVEKSILGLVKFGDQRCHLLICLGIYVCLFFGSVARIVAILQTKLSQRSQRLLVLHYLINYN